jgi:hypothetical protein
MFREWLFAVLKKWLWVLSLVPVIADFVSVYIPSAFIPPPIASFLASDATLSLSLSLFALGLLVSTYLVHRDNQHHSMMEITEFENRLAVYEHHAPSYKIAVTNTMVSLCSQGCHVQVKFAQSLVPLKPWAGHLKTIMVNNLPPLTGLGEWTDLIIQEPNQSTLHLPIDINPPNLTLCISIKAEISIEKQLSESEWGMLEVPITLVIYYFTQPEGDVEIEQQISLPVNLRMTFLDALAYQLGER